MLARYHIVRGKRPPGDPLPDGMRVDTRQHTRHVLRPESDLVAAFLADVDAGWPSFRERYLELLERRWAHDPEPFQRLARLASDEPVHIGCNCPTRRQPDVRRCHTALALQFMKAHFPHLDVVLVAG